MSSALKRVQRRLRPWFWTFKNSLLNWGEAHMEWGLAARLVLCSLQTLSRVFPKYKRTKAESLGEQHEHDSTKGGFFFHFQGSLERDLPPHSLDLTVTRGGFSPWPSSGTVGKAESWVLSLELCGRESSMQACRSEVIQPMSSTHTFLEHPLQPAMMLEDGDTKWVRHCPSAQGAQSPMVVAVNM